MSRFLLFATLALAACDSSTTPDPDPTPAPVGNGLVTATVSGAAPFDANTASVDLASGVQISARTADGRYTLIATSATAPGTTALNVQGTVFRYVTGYTTPAAQFLEVTSGSVTITEYVPNVRARGTFTIGGTLAGQSVTVSSGAFNVVQGNNVP